MSARERDPRVDPRPGDVLIWQGSQRTCLDIWRGYDDYGPYVIVRSKFDSRLAHSVRTSELSSWRKWAKDAKILQRGDA